MPSRHDEWRPGDAVHVHPYGTGTVIEPRNGGRFLVEIKRRAMVVGVADMKPAEQGGASKRRGTSARDLAPRDPVLSKAGASIDLHGKTATEAIDALDDFLNEALLRGDAEVRVIHGRTGGRVKAAVHARLRQITTVRGFKLDPLNPGATIVNL